MNHETEQTSLRWVVGDLNHPEVIELLAEHQARMADNSPPESRHVLDVEALQQPDITFWSLWESDELLGCVALKHWHEKLGEIKSMKTAPAFIRRGVGKRLLEQVLEVAHKKGYQQLKLETGSMDYFSPARKLYSSYGFQICDHFGTYRADPNSVFMCLDLKR